MISEDNYYKQVGNLILTDYQMDILNKNGIENIDDFLYSFIAYSFCNNNGITRDDKTSFEFTEEEIRILYPQYNPEFMLSSLKNWIIKGDFDEEAF